MTGLLQVLSRRLELPEQNLFGHLFGHLKGKPMSPQKQVEKSEPSVVGMSALVSGYRNTRSKRSASRKVLKRFRAASLRLCNPTSSWCCTSLGPTAHAIPLSFGILEKNSKIELCNDAVYGGSQQHDQSTSSLHRSESFEVHNKESTGIYVDQMNYGAAMMKLSVDQTLTRAKSYEKKGEIEQAQELYRTILSTFPKNKRAQQALATLKKIEAVTTDTAINPPPQQLKKLATLLQKGHLEEVVRRSQDLLSEFSSSPALLDILGGAHKLLGNLPDAQETLQKAAELNPSSHQIQNNLGAVLKSAGKLDDAIVAYQNAVTLKPDYFEAHYQLGSIFLEQSELEDAISAYREVLRLEPDHFDAYCDLATALRENGELDESLSTYQKALALKPKSAKAYFNMASALKEKGDIDEAVSNYQKALELRPNFPACYAEATALRGFPVDEKIEEKIRTLSEGAAPDALEQRPLKIALYNVCNRLGEYQEAFNWLVEGAEVRRKELNYTIQQDYDLFQNIFDKTPPYLKNYQFTYKASKTPIFIVGMPRSGTTLTEQIVSSHSSVFGAGELTIFPKIVMPLIKRKEFEDKQVLRLRVKYLEGIEALADDSAFVTDKMPHNFRFLPMICASLPEAKIVHIYRSPQATCWSNFTSNFRSAQLGYSFNLDDAVKYYKLYTSLMSHWSSALRDKIFHLSYEELINDQEFQTRRLMNYLNLEWEEDVLSPHKNTKSVRTASAEQVRQPIYKNSSEKWMQYEPFLSTEFKTLEGFKAP